MDCMKSFIVQVSNSANLVAPDVDFWGLAPQNYWKARVGFTTSSVFNIQGFKNINIWKIKAVGNVISTKDSGNLALVQDWIWYIRVFGQLQNIGGNVSAAPNTFGLSMPNANMLLYLDKYNRSIEFKDPIMSCTKFEVLGLQATGIGAENLTTLNLQWATTFVIYYTFEGED